MTMRLHVLSDLHFDVRRKTWSAYCRLMSTIVFRVGVQGQRPTAGTNASATRQSPMPPSIGSLS